MTLEQIREAKQIAEIEILKIIRNLEKNMGLEVQGIYLSKGEPAYSHIGLDPADAKRVIISMEPI